MYYYSIMIFNLCSAVIQAPKKTVFKYEYFLYIHFVSEFTVKDFLY